MTRSEAIKKALKIKALADRGSTIGERDTAKHKLDEFMKIHNLTDQDLSGPHRYSSNQQNDTGYYSSDFFRKMRDFNRAGRDRRNAEKLKKREDRIKFRQAMSDPEVVEAFKKIAELLFKKYNIK